MQGILNKYDEGIWGLADSHGKRPIGTWESPSRWQILKWKVLGAAKVTVKDGHLWSSMFSGGKVISLGPKEKCPERDSEGQKKGNERKQTLRLVWGVLFRDSGLACGGGSRGWH